MKYPEDPLQVALALAGIVMPYPTFGGLGFYPRRNYQHNLRLIKRTGWWICEHDRCKLRARSKEAFDLLAKQVQCPARVDEVVVLVSMS